MKAKDAIKFIERYNPEEDLVISWFDRADAELWTDEKIDDDMWNVLLDDIGFGYDDISDTIQAVKRYRKEENEDTGQISR